MWTCPLKTWGYIGSNGWRIILDTKKVVGSIPGQSTHLGCRFDPHSKRIKEEMSMAHPSGKQAIRKYGSCMIVIISMVDNYCTNCIIRFPFLDVCFSGFFWGLDLIFCNLREKRMDTSFLIITKLLNFKNSFQLRGPTGLLWMIRLILIHL